MPAKDPATGVHRARYRRILAFAARVLVQTWWYELVLARVGFGRLVARTRDRRMQRVAQRFRALAIDLGGLMIKVGQFLSSRLDVLPPEVTSELADLQDEVPAVPFPAIRQLAEAELGMPLDRAFASFDADPVAAASLGQAHRARLTPAASGDAGFADVIVKVQRPGIDGIVAVDLAALRRVAGWLRRVRIVADRVDAPGLVEEFAEVCHEEIDYLHEAASAERFAEAFADDPRVDAPAIAWERTTRRVLTLSDVTAIKIADTDALRAAGIDPAEVASIFAEVMLDQVFEHGFFHADPHPGNMFVTPTGDPSSPTGWKLTFVDFGMMGDVPPHLRDGLRMLFVAVASRDSRGLVAAAQEIGVLLPSADTPELERILTTLFARFGGMAMSELKDVDPREFRDFAAEFGDTIRVLPVQLPEKLLLLFRTVALTSGMCSSLNPAFSLWSAAEPYAARLLREESRNVVGDLTSQATSSAAILWRMPQRLDAVVTRIEDGSLTFDTSRLERRLDRLTGIARRVASAVLFAGLLIGGALLLEPSPAWATVLIAASALPLLHALFGGRGSRTPR
nr:AarF/UbiB family protein [Microbacterium sp. G2-8]